MASRFLPGGQIMGAKANHLHVAPVAATRVDLSTIICHFHLMKHGISLEV